METAFSAPGHWYKGNLHMHSTESDGRLSPADAVAWYKERGYDFLALTDHRVTTDTSAFSTKTFVLLPGIELDCTDPVRRVGYHILGIGARRFNQDAATHNASGQTLVDTIRAQGGEAIIAHPYWLGQRSGDIAAIAGALGIEVFNGTCAAIGKAHSTVHWDELLDDGHRAWGFAHDDAHHYDFDAGVGWLMVKASRLTAAAILEALREGRFYASQGPAILDLRVDETEICVHTSPVREIQVISNRHRGHTARAERGQTIDSATCPAWRDGYARVECIDAEGLRAWSQPVYFGR